MLEKERVAAAIDKYIEGERTIIERYRTLIELTQENIDLWRDTRTAILQGLYGEPELAAYYLRLTGIVILK